MVIKRVSIGTNGTIGTNEAFSLNISRETVSKRAFLEIFIITGLKSDAILSVVDKNVAIFTTRPPNYSKIRLHSASPN